MLSRRVASEVFTFRSEACRSYDSSSQHFGVANLHTLHYINYITLHCIALPCLALQYSTVQYSTVQYSTVQYSTVQYSTVHYLTLAYITLHYLTLPYITLHYLTLPYLTLHYITLHYITLPYITLHYITLQKSCIPWPLVLRRTRRFPTAPGPVICASDPHSRVTDAWIGFHCHSHPSERT